MPRKGISPKRLERVEKEIAPLIARGLTQREIADRLGISFSQVGKDCMLIKSTWDAEISPRLESARAELVFKHDYLYRQAMACFDKDPSTKWLDSATKQLECLGRLLGQAGPSINLHAHQHNIEVSAGAVAELFKPLDPEAYGAMVAAKPLPPAEAKPLPEVEPEEESGTSEWIAAEPEPTTVGRSDEEPPAKKRKPFPFRV